MGINCKAEWLWNHCLEIVVRGATSCHFQLFMEIKLPVKCSSGEVNKLKAIIDNNAVLYYIIDAKSSTGLSDQLSSYGPALCRSLKWYRKVVNKLLETAMVNAAHIVYGHETRNQISITDFRKAIVQDILMDRAMLWPNRTMKASKILWKRTFSKKEGSAREGCR